MTITIPAAKPLPANVRDAMAKGVPLHKAVAGESGKTSGPKVRVGK